MQRRLKLIVFAFLFFLGFSIFIFPTITNYLYNRNVLKLEKEYEKIVYNLIQENNSNKLDLLYKLLEEENEEIYKNGQQLFISQEKSYEESYIDLKKFGINTDVFGFIEIPSVNIKLPIYLGANSENLKHGAAHLTGTSYPIGGKNTNSVIAAHRSYYKSLMFRNIDRIKIGDIMYLKNFKEKLVYHSVKTEIINPDELNKLTINEGKDMITIISCHPYLEDNKRYVVYFERA